MKKILLAALFCVNARATVRDVPQVVPRPKWLLDGFLKLGQKQPHRLLRIADKLFAPDRVRVSTVEASYAFEWQHRLAMVSALSQFFEPSSEKGLARTGEARNIRVHARTLLLSALMDDPSLLVRDGAVESVRRILRMRPADGAIWKAALEEAFLDKKNHIEGEGLFIRETILTAMREGSLTPSKRVKRAAELDLNPSVRGLLKKWDTNAFDDISAR